MAKPEQKDKLPSTLHFVGVGGIGMSGLAQMAVALGCEVSGSDRALNSPENARIIDSLRACGVKLFPQDGSCYKSMNHNAIVYSTAIEEDNPDFLHAPTSARRIHRSTAMSLAMEALTDKNIFAVSGTCGKTTVSAWLAEALENIGASPGFLCGGLLNGFISQHAAGNFKHGTGKHFVIEADESDKSLLNYTSDHSLILNIGTDHYPKEELADVFRKFILKTRNFTVLEDAAFREIGPDSLSSAELLLFSVNNDSPEKLHGRKVVALDSYSIHDGNAYCSFDGMREIRLPSPGLHNASNALAVYTSLLSLGYPANEAREAVSGFRGVWRRFDQAGKTSQGTAVYDDYAHNVEKIVSCLKAAQELAKGRIFAFFQPHGFGPLKFMREELFNALESSLRKNDVFSFLPVYYAGGKTTFSPTSEEVAGGYKSKGRHPDNYQCFSDRESVEDFLRNNAGSDDMILIMGARDNSLSDWSKQLAAKI